jgi:hypothetical protein
MVRELRQLIHSNWQAQQKLTDLRAELRAVQRIQVFDFEFGHHPFSLDIDQNTYYAWEGLRSFKPRVVVLEYNSSLPADVDWKVIYGPVRPWDGARNFGASLKALEILGRRLGYCLVGCEFGGVNAFFVRDDLVQDKFAEPSTSENHYEPRRHSISFRDGHSALFLDRSIPS